MQVDWWARGLAIAGLVLTVGHLVVNVLIFNRAGGRLRVRIKLRKHPYDPLQHHVVVEIANVGRLAILVKRVGCIEYRSSDEPGALTLPLNPTDGLPVERTLEPTHSFTAEAPMKAIIDRWAPETKLKLKGWAEPGSGRTKSSRSFLSITTPPDPK
jgi:hypothetical protein